MIDPFGPALTDTDTAASPQAQALSLFELNACVSAVLRHALRERYWVKAEISELHVGSSGHCYLELVEKDSEGSALVAKARATIWKQTFPTLSAHFRRATGQPLQAGIKVLVQVQVSFHELYGYALTLTDIEPAFTLGDLAQRRAHILQQLTDDGVIDLNKQLPLPCPITRVAVISSATAAGYGDFCHQLQSSGFTFTTQLFAATMQGEGVEESIIAALDRIASEAARWDVVVILRGGGAVTDLHGFDTYLLAANVAQFPLPVITGIGHERDDTLIDHVAHTKCKTPTAVAAFLIEQRARLADDLRLLQRRLAQAVQQFMLREHTVLTRLCADMQLLATDTLTQARRTLMHTAARLAPTAHAYTATQHTVLSSLLNRAERAARRRTATERQQLATLPLQLSHATQHLLAHKRHELSMLQQAWHLSGPERILSMGYSLTLHHGMPVTHAAHLTPGDEVRILLANGAATAQVTATQGTEAEPTLSHPTT